MAMQARRTSHIGLLVSGLFASSVQGCGTTWELNPHQCENAVLSTLTATQDSSTSEVVISAEVYALCAPSQVYVQFPDNTTLATYSGYNAELEGILLDCSTSNDFQYTCSTKPIPLQVLKSETNFNNYMGYTVFAVHYNSNDKANPTGSMSNYFYPLSTSGDSK